MPEGRPTSLTPKLIEEVADAVRDGLSFAMAAGAAGICRATFYGWQERGRRYKEEGDENDAPFAEFLDVLTQAKDECARRDARVLSRASVGDLAETITEEGNVKTICRPDWRAAESRLKRRFRDDWGDKQNVDHGGDVTVTRVVVDGGLPHIKPAESD